jgi:flagellar assembly factor FliW
VSAATLASAEALGGCELYLEAGLAGFPTLHRFDLSRPDSVGGPFMLLNCVDVVDLAFVVMRPEAFFPTYTPEITTELAQRLGLRGAGEAVVMVVVTLGRRPQDATANLLAPLIINPWTCWAAQVVLEGASYDVRTPLCRS